MKKAFLKIKESGLYFLPSIYLSVAGCVVLLWPESLSYVAGVSVLALGIVVASVTQRVILFRAKVAELLKKVEAQVVIISKQPPETHIFDLDEADRSKEQIH